MIFGYVVKNWFDVYSFDYQNLRKRLFGAIVLSWKQFKIVQSLLKFPGPYVRQENNIILYKATQEIMLSLTSWYHWITKSFLGLQ